MYTGEGGGEEVSPTKVTAGMTEKRMTHGVNINAKVIRRQLWVRSLTEPGGNLGAQRLNGRKESAGHFTNGVKAERTHINEGV